MRCINRVLAIAPVMFCLCGAAVVSRPATGQEMWKAPHKVAPPEPKSSKAQQARPYLLAPHPLKPADTGLFHTFDKSLESTPGSDERPGLEAHGFFDWDAPDEAHGPCDQYHGSQPLTEKCQEEERRASSTRGWLKQGELGEHSHESDSEALEFPHIHHTHQSGDPCDALALSFQGQEAVGKCIEHLVGSHFSQ